MIVEVTSGCWLSLSVGLYCRWYPRIGLLARGVLLTGLSGGRGVVVWWELLEYLYTCCFPSAVTHTRSTLSRACGGGSGCANGFVLVSLAATVLLILEIPVFV